MSNAARQPRVDDLPPQTEPTPSTLQPWTPPPAYRADAREQRSAAPTERPSLYYGCAVVALLCALGWLVAGIADGATAHFVLAVVWLGTTPLFIAGARRAARDRRR